MARADAQPTNIIKVVAASMAGTTVEWYDFFLYGVAAALVFPAVFFPTGDATAGTLASLATFAIGFVARPIGGLVFGHYGDKIGRKKLLVISLLMMGVSTFAIGLLPSYATIGIAAPLLLVALRLVQGFALGGEWGGAVLIVSEHGDPARRGYWASWPQAGVPFGQLLANALLFVLAAVQSEEAFLSWGWRIPFLASAVLVLIGLYVRLAVEESPVFKEAQARAAQRASEGVEEKQMPILEVFRRYPREVFTAMGARFAENVSYYIFTIVITTYATARLGLSSSFVLGAVLIGAGVHLVTIPIWGAVSDRYGRKPVYLFGAVGVGLWAFAFFALVDTRNFWLDHAGHRGRAPVPRRHVRAAGGVPVRAVRHAGALLRRVDRLPAGVHRGGRDRAAGGGLPLHDLRQRLRGRGLRRPDRGSHHRRGGDLRRDPHARPRGGRGELDNGAPLVIGRVRVCERRAAGCGCRR